MAKTIKSDGGDEPRYPSQGLDRFIVRLPDGLRDRIKAAADKNNRSMNSEIVATLEDKFPAVDHLEFAKTLIAFHEATTTAQIEQQFNKAKAIAEELGIGPLEIEYSDNEMIWIKVLRHGHGALHRLPVTVRKNLNPVSEAAAKKQGE